MTTILGKNAPKAGIVPAIALVNPKNASNVGMVVRLASCYGIKQVWWTGNRVNLEEGQRLPREERMKGYMDVDQIQYDRFFDQFDKQVTPVAIEVRANSEDLCQFEHPINPLYVFGPEDGSIPSVLLQHCHRFVIIPTKHCLNLATAVSTVLWDRHYKMWFNGEISSLMTPGEFENRGYNDSE